MAELFFVGLVLWGIYSAIKNLAGNDEVVTSDKYFGPPQIKLDHEVDEKNGWHITRVLFRGMLPVTNGPKELSFSISAFDTTDGEGGFRPLISYVEAAQEERTICYGIRGEIGTTSKGEALTDWAQMGVFIADLCQAPFSGNRKIDIVFRIFDSNASFEIVNGGASDDALFFAVESLRHDFEEKGYDEAVAHRS